MVRQALIYLATTFGVVCGVASLEAEEMQRIVGARGDIVAVRLPAASLVHTAQLVPHDVKDSELPQQGAQVLSQLAELLAEFNALRSDVVKLNVYVRDDQAVAAFKELLREWFGEQAPSVAYVVSPLPNSSAAIGLDAVIALPATASSSVAYHRLQPLPGGGKLAAASVLPRGDAVYVSGQAEPGDLRQATRGTVASLISTLENLGLKKQDVVQLKCFIMPMSDVAIANQEIAAAFQGHTIPPIVYVEWASSETIPIEIELIAAAGKANQTETVSYSTPPGMKASPVYSRVAHVHGASRIYFAGLVATAAGDGASQVISIYQQLDSVLEQCGSDFEHLVKATYYVSDGDASEQLNKLRPNYYNPQRPPAASKAIVPSVAIGQRSISIDMIATPKS
jgi:enamine deaminase RidA (YjgF/YER057c/UK114 family)